MNIAGARNYAGHGSCAQKSIWHCIMMLSEFEAVPIKNTDFNEKDIIEGEKDFYDFMNNLYQLMYKNPEKYAIPTAPYDEYIKSEKFNKPVVKAHQNDGVECKLRNTFQQAIEFYPKYFYQLGFAAEGICRDTFSLIVNKAMYNNALGSLDNTYIYKENGQRIKALADMGIKVEEINDTCHISCKTAPKMFLGLWVLCSAPESKYKYMNYLRLDFKGYLRSMPEIEDVKFTMLKEHAECVDLILSLFANLNLKYKVKPLRSITTAHGLKVEYTLAGKNIFGFFAEPDYLALYIYFNDAKNITEMSRQLENNTELFQWFCDAFPERLCKCKSNRAVMFGNEKRRICGLSNRAEIVNPTADDAAKGIEIIKMFRGL